ncbi:MAG: helix-turn-helix domain-containing protein [Bacteroidales bacterium]
MPGKDSAIIQRLDKLLEEHLQDDHLSVESIASALGYSRSHLHRLVYRATGKSISQYIREYRLEIALKLFQQEHLNVSEAAYRVGFGSASYFSKSFNEYFGFPPSETSSIQDHVISQDSEVSSVSKKKLWSPRAVVPVLVVLVLIFFSMLFFKSWIPGQGRKTEGGQNSIALLPFTNLTSDPDNQFFSQGINDAIARKLSIFDNIRVVSRISTSQYVDHQTSIKQIAREMRTAYVLVGSIQRFGEKVRIEVGLVNGSTGINLWSENYDREFKDIFEVENEIAEHVAESLNATLSNGEEFGPDRGYTTNPLAYELYLKGLFELRTYTSSGAKKSTEYFKAAVDMDPEFAMAHNWLGHSYIAQAAMFGMELDAIDGLEKAFPYIERSVELDPGLKEARPIRAFYFLYHDWDFEKAEQEYILALNKSQPESYALYADYLNFVRRHDEALEWSEKQDQNEPYYPNPRKIQSLYYVGRVDEAIAYAENRLRVQKNYWMMDGYGFVLLNAGRFEEAIAVFQEIFQIEQKRYPRILGWLGAAFARSGQEEKAWEIIEELQAMKAKSSASSPAFYTAVVYAALKESDAAIHWLKRAVNDHEMEIPWLISEPQLYDLHDNPGFQDLVKEVGFPVQSGLSMVDQ